MVLRQSWNSKRRKIKIKGRGIINKYIEFRK